MRIAVFPLLFFLFLPFIVFSQEEVRDSLWHHSPDTLYREDQFYFGVTYNLLINSPRGISSRGLSGGLQGGFVRDMPINKRRNLAVAVGIGLAYDQYGQNLFIGEEPTGETIFKVLDGTVDFDQNRLGMALVEMPVEFRWRTSTPTEYRFWRIYAGARVGYAYWYKATFRQPGNRVDQTKIPEFNPLRVSATLSFGYNTFNFFASYSLNPFFDNAYLPNGEKVEWNALKLGLMFYIL